MQCEDGGVNIVLGVSGGIAAYKAVLLARLFVEAGHELHVVPTAEALRFVGLPTWEAISRNPVTTSVHDDVPEVRAGTECGIAVRQYNDVQVGDQIECFERTSVERTL